MYVYARINKETLKFIREKKAVSFDYVSRITKFTEEKISLWEDTSTEKYPTINQAKKLAKCYRIPFAGLYMNATDINIKHLPKMRNLRTLPNAKIDNSALNLAIADILSARELLIESQAALKEHFVTFSLTIQEPDDVFRWAKIIRNQLKLDIDTQYNCTSMRQFYLYVRNMVEKAGVFVHCFTGIDTDVVRGFAIYDDLIPIIGLNNEDRYPAKTFSIIHELVHIIKRSSAICNEMMSSFSSQSEEVFCNAVAGEVLVPKANLLKQFGNLTSDEVDLDLIDILARKFSVSKEVICRRMLDLGLISRQSYLMLVNSIRVEFEKERKQAQEYRKLTGKVIPRNIPRETIDKNSTTLCKTFYHGFREGYFDKQDIARYLGVKQHHIDRFIQEVSRW